MNKMVENMLWHMKLEGASYPIFFLLNKAGMVPDENYKKHRKKKWDRYIQKKRISGKDYRQEVEGWLKYCTKEKPYDLNSPGSFNEKIQWLKIYDNTPLKTKLVDKYAVREWVKDKIGEEYLIPLACKDAVWDSADEIDFAKLPEQFVLKANHGSRMNLIVKNKADYNVNDIKKMAQTWLDTTYGWFGFETQYFDVPRKIIAEKYMEQIDGNLLDYKIYCFNGEPTYFQMIGDRDHINHTGRLAFYDTGWNLMDFDSGDYPPYERLLEKPENLRELIDISHILSEGFKFVRVDLYDIDGKIYFGEMTFTPGNGILPWRPDEANEKLGELLNLE